MATKTLEVTAAGCSPVIEEPTNYVPGRKVTCGDCSKEVPIEHAYHARNDKWYCLATCLAEHLDSVD